MNFSRFLAATSLTGAMLLHVSVASAQTDPAPGPVAGGTGPTSGQTTTTTPPIAEAQTPAEQQLHDPVTGTDRGDIVVVGSRIARSAYNTADEVQIVTPKEATLQGFNSPSEVLQSTAITGGAGQINNEFGGLTGFNGGPGGNTLSLRGLGADRTLILLNGRRLSPSGATGFTGATDLNVLPSAIVERYEILKSGASSVYGSDAIAGVVNIVTDSKFRGLTLNGQSDVPQSGAGASYRLSAVVGFGTDRFSFIGSVDYYRQNSLTLGDRSFTQCQTQYRRTATNRTPGSGDLIDPLTGLSKCYPTGNTGENGVTVNTIGTSNVRGALVAQAPGVPAGYTGNCNRFRPSASAGGAIPGFQCVGGGTLGLNIRDTFDTRILNDDLISPTTNYTGFAQAAYKLQALGDAEIYSEILANRRDSNQTSFRQFTLDYLKGSPLIPANLAFSTIGAAGFSTANPTSPIGVRVFAAYGNYQARQESDYIKPSLGIRGDFFIPRWRYNAYVSQSWSNASYTTDLILTNRLGNSLDVVQNANGTFSCRSGAAGCVAAPAITTATIGGQFPQAFLNYVVQPVTGHTYYRETTYTLDFNGPLFKLPGGDAQLAVGAEHRRDSIHDQPSPDAIAANLYNFSSSQPTIGTDQVWEGYGEVELPFLRNLPWMHDLTVNASGRYTDYRSYGGQWTYKAGGNISPTKWFTVRGSYGTSYRAPALFEQFLGASTGFLSQTTDPCYQYGQANAPTSTRYKNCASEGLDPQFIQTNSVASFAGGGSGTGLKAETSSNFTVGGVLQFSGGENRFGNISFAADYFRTDVKNEVAQAGTANILSLCYDDPGFRTSAGRGYCNLVTRNAVTNALTVNNNYTNIGESIVRGIDFNLRYAHMLGSGRLVIDVQATKYYEQSSRQSPTSPLVDYNKTLETPDWTGTAQVNYEIGKLLFHYGLDYVRQTQSYDLYGLDPTSTVYYLQTPDYFQHSASVQIALPKQFTMTFGVHNFTNVNPPSISSGVYSRVGNAPLYSGYDVYGRRFFLGVTAHY